MDTNTWLITVFGIYIASVVTYSIVYFRLYEKDHSRFLFNEKAMEKQHNNLIDKLNKTTSDSIKNSPLLLDVLGYLEKHQEIKSIKNKWILLESGNSFKYSRDAFAHQGGAHVLTTLKIRDEKEELIFDHRWNDVDGLIKIISEHMSSTEALIKSLSHKISTSENQYPDFWSYFDFLYFSVISQTTVGYGDILPNSTLIRKVVITLVMLGLLTICCHN